VPLGPQQTTHYFHLQFFKFSSARLHRVWLFTCSPASRRPPAPVHTCYLCLTPLFYIRRRLCLELCSILNVCVHNIDMLYVPCRQPAAAALRFESFWRTFPSLAFVAHGAQYHRSTLKDCALKTGFFRIAGTA